MFLIVGKTKFSNQKAWQGLVTVSIRIYLHKTYNANSLKGRDLATYNHILDTRTHQLMTHNKKWTTKLNDSPRF